MSDQNLSEEGARYMEKSNTLTGEDLNSCQRGQPAVAPGSPLSGAEACSGMSKSLVAINGMPNDAAMVVKPTEASTCDGRHGWSELHPELQAGQRPVMPVAAMVAQLQALLEDLETTQDEVEQEAFMLAECHLVTCSRQQQLTLLETEEAKGQVAAAQASLAEALVQEEAARKRRGAALASAQNMQRCLRPHLQQLMKLVKRQLDGPCVRVTMKAETGRGGGGGTVCVGGGSGGEAAAAEAEAPQQVGESSTADEVLG